MSEFNCKECGEFGSVLPADHRAHQGILFLVSCVNKECPSTKLCQWHVCAVCAVAAKSTIVLTKDASQFWKHVQTKKHTSALGLLEPLVINELLSPDLQDRAEKKRDMDRQREVSVAMDEFFPGQNPGDCFFRQEFLGDGRGIHELVKISCFKRKGCVDNAELDDFEVRTDFLGCCKYWPMSQRMRAVVVEHDRMLYLLGRLHQKEEAEGRSLSHPRIVPPKSYNELRGRCFRDDTSLTSNLPIPSIETHVSQHACLDPENCIRHFLALGIQMESIELRSNKERTSYGWITETPRADELRDSASDAIASLEWNGTVLLLPILTWQDDFDPNNSTKNNRGSVWAQTGTIAPHRDNRNSPHQTYPLIIARSKKNSHEAAQCYLRGRLEELATKPITCYSKTHGAPVAVLCYEYARLQDQPERRKDLSLAPGQSNWHARFIYSCHSWQLIHVMRTCSGCLTSLRQGILPKSCKICVCWDVAVGLAPDAPPEIVERLKLKLPDGYPLHHLINEAGIEYVTPDNRVLPFPLSAQRLICSSDLGYRNLLNRKWTNKQAIAFMKRECFNDELIKNITDTATNARSLREIQEGISTEPPLAQRFIQEEAVKCPHLYSQPEPPKSWDVKGGLSVFVDVLMHLLFLGIVKSTLKTLRVWMCKQGKNAEFNRLSGEFNDILKSVSGLDWLKCEEYGSTGKFGGWVSENFLGFSRVLKWFFQDVPNLDGRADSEDPGDRPISRWNKPHYVHWLKSRGLKTDGLALPALKEKYKEIMKLDPPPPVLQTVAGEFLPEQVQRMLVALDEMLSSIMIEEVIPGVTVPHMELKIKQFLTEFDLLDQQVKSKTDKPKVFTSFNFMSLLNLPKLTERFGPLRNLWEGGYKGEGGIKDIKAHTRHGQRHNFERHAMSNVLKERSLKFLSSTLLEPPPETTLNQATWGKYIHSMATNFKTYRSRESIFNLSLRKKALSVVVCSKDGHSCVFCVVQERQRADLQFVVIDARTQTWFSKVEKMGSAYYEWIVRVDVITDIPLPLSRCSVSFGALLPLLSDGGSPKHMLVRSQRYGV